jgi:hypothetical protein
MKRLLWAALLALPLLAVSEQKASAWGCCGGCGHGHYFPCMGIVPGPWYLYWPGSSGAMEAPGTFGHWHYPCHFQTPAPIGESFCSDYGGFYPSYWYGR